VLRDVVLTQYRRVTDGMTDRQTDGIAVSSTALAMRALHAEQGQKISQQVNRAMRGNKIFGLLTDL